MGWRTSDGPELRDHDQALAVDELFHHLQQVHHHRRADLGQVQGTPWCRADDAARAGRAGGRRPGQTPADAPPWHQRPSRRRGCSRPTLGRFCRTVEKRRSGAGIIATALTASAMARSSAGSSGMAGVAMQVRISCSQNWMRAGVGSRCSGLQPVGLPARSVMKAATEGADRDLRSPVEVEQHQARRRVPLARERQQEHLQRRLADAGRADDQRVARQLLLSAESSPPGCCAGSGRTAGRRVRSRASARPRVAVALAAGEVVAAGQGREGAWRSLASRGRHCQLPGIWRTRRHRPPGHRRHLQAGASPTGADGLRARRPASATSLAEDDQAVVVLAHAELTVAEFVERDVHLGDLAGHHVVAGDRAGRAAVRAPASRRAAAGSRSSASR